LSKSAFALKMHALCGISSFLHQQVLVMPKQTEEKTLNFQSLISLHKPLCILQAGTHSSQIISKAVTISKTSGLFASGFL